jgi:hypothetical protein
LDAPSASRASASAVLLWLLRSLLLLLLLSLLLPCLSILVAVVHVHVLQSTANPLAHLGPGRRQKTAVMAALNHGGGGIS